MHGVVASGLVFAYFFFLLRNTVKWLGEQPCKYAAP